MGRGDRGGIWGSYRNWHWAREGVGDVGCRCAIGGRSAVLAMDHVAILHPAFIELLLSGRKRIESRFSRVRRLPYGAVAVGDRVYFKSAGCSVRAVGVVSQVAYFHDLTAYDIAFIQRSFGEVIGAPAAYWEQRMGCRWGSLIWLRDVRRTRRRVVVPRQFGAGWVVLGAGDGVLG